MKRIFVLLLMVVAGAIYTAPVSAQNGGIVSVRFAPGRFTCGGAGEVIVDVAYNGTTDAWVSVETGIMTHRTVNSTRVSVALGTEANGAVYGSAIRVIVRFGSVMSGSNFDKRTYWFECSTGNLLTSQITLQNDTTRIPEIFPSPIFVLGNDTSQLSWNAVSVHRPASAGTVTVGAGGLYFIYTPNAGFIGIDTFDYQACNIGGVCRAATVTVNVYDLQQPAVSSAVLHSTTCGADGLLDVQLYFAGPAYLTVISGITSVVELTQSNTAFEYVTISDIPISSAGVVVGGNAVRVQVLYGTSPNDGTYHNQVYWFNCNTGQPITPAIRANNDSANALENFPVAINVAANDTTNLGFDWTQFSITSAPSRGSAVISSNGVITYTYGSNTDFNGTDSFVYEICNFAGMCRAATVTVTIIDLPPPTIDSIELVEFACEGPGLVDVTVTYSGGPAVITVITGSTASMDISNSDTSSFGSQTVSIPISSDNGGVQGDNVLIIDVLYGTAIGDDSYDNGTFYFDCVTGEPIVPSVNAVDDYAPEVARSTPIEVDVLANDTSRLPLDISTFVLTSSPDFGTVVIVNGLVQYTGDGVTIGVASFTYEICNSEGFCDDALVELNVVNLPPVCGGSSEIFIEVWPPNHSMVPIHIGGVYDPDGDPITYTLVSVTIYENDRSWNGDTTEIDFDTENGLIRAERAGNGNGRIYAVEYIASDPDGLSCDGFAYIFVPHDQRNHGSAYPEFDIDGNPFPALPDDINRGNNGNGNGNGNSNGNGNNQNPQPVEQPPVEQPPVEQPPTNTDTSSGQNNGLGNDRENGNAQGEPQRDNNNGNANGNSNGNGNSDNNDNQNPPVDSGNPPPIDVSTPVPETNNNNGNGNGNSNGNGNGNGNGNSNGNGNGN